MRVLFAGTPDVALPSLAAILASPHEVVGVLTRPDARAGRGRHVGPSPVKAAALDAGLPVLTPRTLRDPAVAAEIAALGADCAAVVAYGALLPVEILDIPRYGWINLHFSLLPAWRGAAPVQHAILHGDEISGATTFRITAGLDEGPVFGTLTESIRPRDTAGDLLARLAQAGAGLLTATLDGVEAGQLTAVPQPTDGVSLAPRLSADDGRVRWEHPALSVDRRVRACTPAPGAWTSLPDGTRLNLGPVRALPDVTLPPGALQVGRHEVAVGTGTHAVLLGDVAAAGKRPMPAADWARGARLPADVRLGTP